MARPLQPGDVMFMDGEPITILEGPTTFCLENEKPIYDSYLVVNRGVEFRVLREDLDPITEQPNDAHEAQHLTIPPTSGTLDVGSGTAGDMPLDDK